MLVCTICKVNLFSYLFYETYKKENQKNKMYDFYVLCLHSKDTAMMFDNVLKNVCNELNCVKLSVSTSLYCKFTEIL